MEDDLIFDIVPYLKQKDILSLSSVRKRNCRLLLQLNSAFIGALSYPFSLRNFRSLVFLDITFSEEDLPILVPLSVQHLKIRCDEQIANVSQLTNLLSLDCNQNNELVDLRKLDQLTGLTILCNMGIRSLSYLTNLIDLKLYWNRVPDIIKLTKLESLYLREDRCITDLSTMSNLTSLVLIENTLIKDISYFTKLNNLQVLWDRIGIKIPCNI